MIQTYIIFQTPFIYRCFQNGRRNFVVPKANSAEDGSWVGLAMYAWSGSVLECRICGVIYRSRQHWFGNETPEATAVVHTEISHIWPGVRTLQGKAGLFEENHICDIRFQFEFQTMDSW